MKNKNEASILIVSLVILTLILIIGLNLSLISSKQRKASIDSSYSNIAYQMAEGGVEYALQKLVGRESTDTLNNVFGAACSVSEVSQSMGGGNVKISFYADDGAGNGTKVNCGDVISGITSLVSSGSVSGQTRAIKAPVSFFSSCSPGAGQVNMASCHSVGIGEHESWSTCNFDNNELITNIYQYTKDDGRIKLVNAQCCEVYDSATCNMDGSSCRSIVLAEHETWSTCDPSNDEAVANLYQYTKDDGRIKILNVQCCPVENIDASTCHNVPVGEHESWSTCDPNNNEVVTNVYQYTKDNGQIKISQVQCCQLSN